MDTDTKEIVKAIESAMNSSFQDGKIATLKAITDVIEKNPGISLAVLQDAINIHLINFIKRDDND